MLMLIRFVKLLVSIIICIFDQFNELAHCLLRKSKPIHCVVLYYHNITSEYTPKFAKQMESLLRLATPVRADIKTIPKDGSRFVALTFDDGFVSVFENAIPFLISRNIPFTVFIPVGSLATKPSWIKNKDHACSQEIVVDTKRLRGLKNNTLVSIGSHCITHTNLLIMDDEMAKDEITRSKSILESILQQEVTLLSFPHGAYSENHVVMAQEAGYSRVFSIDPSYALVNPGELVTGRISVEPWDWNIEFQLKIIGAYRWLPIAFKLKKKLKGMIQRKLI